MSDTAQAIQPVADCKPARPEPSKPLQVTGRLREAIRLMIEQGIDYAEAGNQVGLHARQMRKALQKQHVLSHIRHQRQVLRTAICAANDFHLARIRNGSNNAMAVVQAVRGLEQLDTEHQTTGSKAHSPGFVVIVQAHAVQPDANPAKPLITLENTKDVP